MTFSVQIPFISHSFCVGYSKSLWDSCRLRQFCVFFPQMDRLYKYNGTVPCVVGARVRAFPCI